MRVAQSNQPTVAMMRFALLPLQGPFELLELPAKRRALALWITLIASIPTACLTTPELALASFILALGLAWAAMIDIDRFVLPDILTLSLIVIGLALALREGPSGAWPYIVGTAAGYLALAGVAQIYRRVCGRNGLGLGDAKLLTVAGAWLGWMARPFVVLIASLVCLVSLGAIALWRRQTIPSGPIPFGPYLAGAIWIVWLVQIGGRA